MSSATSASRARSTTPAVSSCSTTACAAAGAIIRRSSCSSGRRDRPPITTSPSWVASTSPTAATTAACHEGDPQPARLDDDRYGDRPPWHDIQLRLTGPAVADVAHTFRERWEDPNPLDTPSPWRVLRHRLSHTPPRTWRSGAAGAGAGAAWQPRGPGAPHVSGTAEALSVRTRRRAQHRPRLQEGVRERTHADLPRGSVPLVARRDACAVRRATAEPGAALRDRHPSLSRSGRAASSEGRAASADGASNERWREPAATESRSSTSRTTTTSRSTCTRRSASSTTRGWRSDPTTSTVARGPTTRRSAAAWSTSKDACPARRACASLESISTTRTCPTMRSVIRSDGSTRCATRPAPSMPGSTTASRALVRGAISEGTHATRSHPPRGRSSTSSTLCCSTPTGGPRGLRRAGRY